MAPNGVHTGLIRLLARSTNWLHLSGATCACLLHLSDHSTSNAWNISGRDPNWVGFLHNAFSFGGQHVGVQPKAVLGMHKDRHYSPVYPYWQVGVEVTGLHHRKVIQWPPSGKACRKPLGKLDCCPRSTCLSRVWTVGLWDLRVRSPATV